MRGNRPYSGSSVALEEVPRIDPIPPVDQSNHRSGSGIVLHDGDGPSGQLAAVAAPHSDLYEEILRGRYKWSIRNQGMKLYILHHVVQIVSNHVQMNRSW